MANIESLVHSNEGIRIALKRAYASKSQVLLQTEYPERTLFGKIQEISPEKVTLTGAINLTPTERVGDITLDLTEVHKVYYVV